jgi:hypothetical protein
MCSRVTLARGGVVAPCAAMQSHALRIDLSFSNLLALGQHAREILLEPLHKVL